MIDTFVKGRPNIFVCLPAYGGSIITQTVMSLIQLAQELQRHNIGAKFGTVSFPDIDEVRNIMTSIFYDKTPMATHCLMIDADMRLEPQLILDMLDSEHPLVGIIPVKKIYPLQFVGRALPGEQEPVNGFMKVDGCGAGVVMFTREVISEMLLKLPEIVDKYPIDKHPASELILAQGLTRLLRPWEPIVSMEIGRLSEDLSFSHRWIHKCGGEVWANIRHPVGHIGHHEFCASYEVFLNEQKAKQEAEAKAAQEAAMKVAAE